MYTSETFYFYLSLEIYRKVYQGDIGGIIVTSSLHNHYNCITPLMLYKPNLVSLHPDNKPITLETTSATGWYVLYTPSNSRSTPLPVYHIQNSTQYLGWTTETPASCQGESNYQVGLSSLIFQAVEDAPVYWNQPEFSTSTTDINLIGRCTEPRIPLEGVMNETEVYCLFNLYTTTREIKKVIVGGYYNLYLGLISYRLIPGEVLVNQSYFGRAITANLRSIGNYQDVVIV